MAKWQPESETVVGKNEHLGRRLFDEPMLAGATKQKPFTGLLLRHFEETRDLEFSLDRLGRTSVELAVVRYLMPRVDAAANKFRPPKAFDGWFVIKAEFLKKPKQGPPFPVTPSPDMRAGLDENRYHAHATLPATADTYTNALQLKYLFEQHGKPQPAVRSTSPDGIVSSWWGYPWRWFRSKISGTKPPATNQAR